MAKCKHKLMGDARYVPKTRNDDGSIIVSVVCDECSVEGSIRIMPSDVQWDEDEDEETPDPEAFVTCGCCGAQVKDGDSWGDGDVGDRSVPSFCSERCYKEGEKPPGSRKVPTVAAPSARLLNDADEV